jgi:hypothetical protein
LPSNLSGYTWIENTNKNLAVLDQEKEKLNEEKRQKELEKKIKL